MCFFMCVCFDYNRVWRSRKRRKRREILIFEIFSLLFVVSYHMNYKKEGNFLIEKF